MPVVGMGRTTDLLSTHNSQLSEHGIASAFVSPLLNTVAISTTTIGQAVGVISSSTSNFTPTAIPMPASMAPPPKQLTGSKPDVVCPLPNPDGSGCRKTCSGTFAYRSICEHIRRAHPEHWIPKLPASAESFHKMIQTPPAPRDTVVYDGQGATGGVQLSMNGGTQKRTTTGSGPRTRVKVPKSRSSPDDQDLVEGMSPQSSTPESHSHVATPTLAESKEILAHDIAQQSVPSETDTESDHTHSPSSPSSLLALSTSSFPIQPYKATSVIKSKPTSSRKKSSSSSGSKTKSSPRKVPTRRRTVDKKTSGSTLAAMYSTPFANHSGPSSLSAGADMMDVDTESTSQQHYVFSHGYGESRHVERRDELDPDEVSLILGAMSTAAQHISNVNTGAPQLRRAFSFSVGDGNGHHDPVPAGGRSNLRLSLSTNILFERGTALAGSMSAGCDSGNALTGGSRWDDLLEAAEAAAEENKVPERKSPLLYQSVLPRVSGESCVSRRNTNPYGPDLPAPLKMMTDIATAEAQLNQIQRHQQHFQHQHHAHPHNYMQNYAHTQHHYAPSTSVYHQQHHHYLGHTPNHTTISPILHGASLASLNSSNATSHASTPAYSKPPSPRAEALQSSPKIQCSLCRVHVQISMAFACTECISGFCHGCVPPSEKFELEGEGLGSLSKMKIGSPELEIQNAEKLSKKRAVIKGKNPGAMCGVCGIAGAKYKPVRLIVHV